MNDIGDFLRKARLNLVLTLKEVATELGVSTAYLSDIELGRRPVPVNRLPQFAQILFLSKSNKYELYRRAGVLPEELKNVDFNEFEKTLIEILKILDKTRHKDLAKKLRNIYPNLFTT